MGKRWRLMACCLRVCVCVQLVQESSGTSLFFSESPVEPPKDGVAEFVTAAAKAFAQGEGGHRPD